MTLALAWTLAVRWSSLALVGPDEAFYVEVAHLWTKGVLPYVGAFDVKAPGFFALLAGAERLFGPDLAALRALSVLSDAVAAAALFGLGRRLGPPALGVFAAALYPILSVWLAANDAYPPLAAATTLAFLAALSEGPPTRRALLAGLAAGAAATIKQTAVLEAAAITAVFVLEAGSGKGRLRAPLVFLAGAAFAPLAFAAYFAAHDALGALARATVVDALQRPGADSESIVSDLIGYANLERLVGVLFAGAVVGLARLGVRAPDERSAALRATALWFAAAALELLVQHARWTNYLGPTLAPTILLGGVAAVEFGASAARRGAPLRLAFLAALTLPTAYPARASHYNWARDAAQSAEVVRIVRARRPAPDDRLLALGFGVWFNVDTGLDPPTRFFALQHLTGAFPEAGLQRLVEAFAARPRFVALGRIHGHLQSSDDARAEPVVAAALASAYHRIGHVEGRVEVDDVYERNGG